MVGITVSSYIRIYDHILKGIGDFVCLVPGLSTKVKRPLKTMNKVKQNWWMKNTH